MSNGDRWLPIPGHPGYEACNNGQIRSVDRMVKGRDGSIRRIGGKVLTAHIRPSGVPAVNLWSDNSYRQIPVGQLVLAAFWGRSALLPAVHINGDPFDNRLENLKWSE